MVLPLWQSHDFFSDSSFDGFSLSDEPRMRGRFTAPSGRVFALDGFWCGKNRWCVRFAPTEPGEWSYILETDGKESAGTFTAEAKETGNPLFDKGFPTLKPGKRYFEYADGTPFFWLGDTHWLGLGGRERLYESNSPFFSSMFKGMAEVRKNQGFTVYQLNFFASAKGDCDGRGTSNEGGRIWTGQPFEGLNPAFFENTDERIDTLCALGLVPCLGLDWGHAISEETVPQFRAIARYIIARYASKPVIWFVCGEYAPHYREWGEIGKVFEACDPYAHPTTVHGNGENFVDDPSAHVPNADYYRESPWFDFIMMQTGHLPTLPNRNVWKYYYDREPVKPVIEAENAYEGIWDVKPPLTREQAIVAFMHGACGFSYGAEGVWDATWDTNDFHQVIPPWFPVPWYDAIFLPQAFHLGHVKEMLCRLAWWTLEPRDCVKVTPAKHSMREICAKVSPDDSLALVYYPTAEEEYKPAVCLTSFPAESIYTARWFDPMTGSLTAAGQLTADTDGTLVLPEKPQQKRFDRLLILEQVKGETA